MTNYVWTTGDCDGIDCSEGWWFPPAEDWTDCSDHSTETFSKDCRSYSDEMYDYYENYQITLSSVYSTGELVGYLRSNLDALDYPTNWNGGAASLSFACSERVADASKMKYRLYFQSETNTTYKVSWEEVTAYQDGTSETATLSEIVEGDGQIVYTTEHEKLPPSKAGTIYVQLGPDGGVEIIPPPDESGGSGPGSGGPGGHGFGGAGGGGGPRRLRQLRRR